MNNQLTTPLSVWIILGPSLVAAAAAIASAVLTNLYAERRARRELENKERDQAQRLVEGLIPQRLAAYESVFAILQRVKDETVVDVNVIQEFMKCLLWIEPSFAARILQFFKKDVRGNRTSDKRIIQRASELQAEVRRLLGLTQLDGVWVSANNERGD